VNQGASVRVSAESDTLDRCPQDDPVVLVRHIEDGLAGRDLLRDEDADPAGVEGLVSGFRFLGEAGSDLGSLHTAGE